MMKKQLIIIGAGLIALGIVGWTSFAKHEAKSVYADYVQTTYKEEADVEATFDWKQGGYVGRFTLKEEPFKGSYWVVTYPDGSMYDDVMEVYWQKEAETSMHERLVKAGVLQKEETVRATVPNGVDLDRDIQILPSPTSIYEVHPEQFLDLSIMFHEDWNNTDEQKQRIVDVIHQLRDDVNMFHFSFDGNPGGNDDFTERYMLLSRNADSIATSFLDIQTVDDLNAYDRLYGYDSTTFIYEYHFDGTKIEDEMQTTP
ncbi:hypothetical protein [Exiguobacterium algae]|uniref:hypothetical protein n=1 Tax=Exiguobacterium algae TaxID=2751250 RepID=UPI001BEBD3FC|nr:hypothetical protein [Exiguobacterium algae]